MCRPYGSPEDFGLTGSWEDHSWEEHTEWVYYQYAPYMLQQHLTYSIQFGHPFDDSHLIDNNTKQENTDE